MNRKQIENLIWALRSLGDLYARTRAVETLVKIGKPAVEPLINALWDEDSCVRKHVIEALGRIGDTRAIEPLIKTLWDSDADVRLRAAEALGKIGALTRALGDENADVRSKVVEALEKLMWKPKTEIERAYYHVAKKEWDSTASLGLTSVEPLIGIISDSGSGVQRSAFEVLSKIFPQIIEIIFGEFPSNNSRTSVKNIDVSQLTMHMSSLTKVHIDADTYDFDMVERFITYAINYVGQKHLRKKVEVHIYGNPEKLHQNILNSFKNLCRKVVIQGKE